MSRVRRRISRVVGSEPKWAVLWPPIGEVDTEPPNAETQAAGPTYYIPIPDDGGGPRIFEFFYIPAYGSTDPTNGFWNSFFNRVPKWEVFADESHDELPELLISPGNFEGLTEPISLPLHGGSGWAVLTDDTVMVGSRDAYIKNEEKLPNRDPRSIDDGEGSFQYTRTLSYDYPGKSSVAQRVYTFKVLAHQGFLYNGVMYFPCVHSDLWYYTDDAGSSGGGFISNYLDNTGDPGVLEPSHVYSTKIRLGKRDYSSDQHTAFSFSAYELTRLKILSAAYSSTEVSDAPHLEVNGTDTASDVWIQPDRASSEIYFGYRSDNSDDSTAIYDPDTGHLNMAEADFPLTM